jgi:membrane protease YdiL (CAAX protease family)
VASSCVLGLCCGLARQLSGSLAAPILLHVLYNAMGLGNARGWFVTERFPKEGGVPTLLAAAGAACLLAMLPLWLLRRRRAART